MRATATGAQGHERGRSRPGFQLTVNGLAGRNYRFEGSTDLITWDPLATVAADSSGLAQYLDATAGLNQRFYRVALLP